MFIIFGLFIPLMLLLFTRPIQHTITVLTKVIKKQELALKKKADKQKESSKKDSLSNKFKGLSLKALRHMLIALRTLLGFLRSVASLLLTLMSTFSVILIPMCILLLLTATLTASIFISNKNTTTPSNTKTVVSTKDESDDDLTGDIFKVRWNQNNYKDTIAGSGTISGGGCGWCSLVHMMAILNPEKCAKMKPNDWLPVMSSSVKNNWAGGRMGWGAPKAWVDYINSIKKYGKYKLVKEIAGSVSDESSKNILKTIQKYKDKKNTVAVLSTSGSGNDGMFTHGGHIILLTSITDDYFTITDSSPVSMGFFGKSSSNTKEWFAWNKHKFPIGAGQKGKDGKFHHYWIKRAWVITRVK